MIKFVQFCIIHSEFMLLDGANRIKDLPVRAKELGMNDYGNYRPWRYVWCN